MLAVASAISLGAQTDANGQYTLRVTDNFYEVRAYHTVEYNGQSYTLPLHPVDGEVDRVLDSRPGIVKDFVWKLSGLTGFVNLDTNKASSYYGGGLILTGSDPTDIARTVTFPAGTTLEVTATPTGPLIDGRQGETKVFKYQPKNTALYLDPENDRSLKDIPIGPYTVTARAVAPNGAATPLRVAVRIRGSHTTELASSASFVFPPTSSLATIGAGLDTGVGFVDLYLVN
jgi:hypothetical protein